MARRKIPNLYRHTMLIFGTFSSLRPRDYKELHLKSSVEFTNRAKPLISKNFLKKEVKGNVANYKVTGVIHLAQSAGVDV